MLPTFRVDHRYNEVGPFTDSGRSQENHGPGNEGSRGHELTTDTSGKASGSIGGKHGSSPMGSTALQRPSVVPKTVQAQITEITDMMLQVPLKVRNSLCWWTVSSNMSRGKLYHFVEEEHLVTDTILSGWRAVWKYSPVQGTWSQKEVKSPISLLELRAICLVMLHFTEDLKNKHVLV